MPEKKNSDALPGYKLLLLFKKLMLDGRCHFQSDLARECDCSPQTIGRMADVIESVIGLGLERGFDERRRYYRMKTLSKNRLGLDCEELRFLTICRDFSAQHLPEQVIRRVDDTIFTLSMLLADQEYVERTKTQQPQFAFFSKGRIEYTQHYETIEKLVQAVEERRFCLVRYTAAGKNEEKEHRFAPGRIVSMSGALYIVGAGMTEDFAAIRHTTTLAVHRITDVTLTDRQFDFEPPEAEPGSFGLPWHEPRTFRICFKPGKTADYVRERIWADSQILEDMEDGGLMLTITTRSEPEVMAWVRSFGEEAKLC